VLGFASIAGGSASSVKAMTNHLLNNTLTDEHSRLAAYYTRGLARQAGLVLSTYADLVAKGSLSFGEALDGMTASYRRGGDKGGLDAIEARMITRLAEAVMRVERGEPAILPPLAVLRQDMHPLVALGLGIDPEEPLNRDQIDGLLAGRRANGEKIAGKHYAKVRHLGVNEKTGEDTVSLPIGSYDFCPSPDKSVSVAWAFAAPAEQAMIFNAHIEAARAAVAYIATEVGVARTGKGGEGDSIPGHVGWLEFTHHTSRRVRISVTDGETKVAVDSSVPGDPSLHTHFLIPNAVFCEDSRVGSLNTKRVAGFIFEADAFYHATLAQNLRDAGFDAVMDPTTGAARMPAVPDDIRSLFSKQSNAAEAAARAFTQGRGEEWDDLSPEQRTARMARAAKSLEQKIKGGKDDIADVADWKRQAKAVGWQPTSFIAYGPPAPELSDDLRHRMALDAGMPFISTKLEQRSVVSHFDLRVGAGRGLVDAGIKGLDDFNAVTALMRSEGVVQFGERTALMWGQEENRVSVTTTLHVGQEREFVALAKSAARDRSGALPGELLERKIRESGLDFSDEHGKAQLAMIRRLGSAGRLGVAIAAAGAGKTAALQPLVAAWKEQGREVFGASLAWQRADELTDAGIAQKNVKAFSVLIDAAKTREIKLERNSVVAVDELGLLGTRQGLELLRLRERHGFSVVALGDDKQCSSIEAGAIIELSRRALGPEHMPVIVTTVRQQTEREREIVGLFREGRAKEALDMKRQDGTAEMVPGGYPEAVARVAKLYAERLRETGVAPTVSAPTNRDAHRLSLAIRDERRAMGLIGPDTKRIALADPPGGGDARMALAVGDRVRLFKSTGARFSDGRGGNIGRNGSVLEVLALDDNGMTARSMKTGRTGWISWPSLADQGGRIRLAYGDVMTVQTAQGSTAPEHIVALPSGSRAVNGLQAYSAGTRHRQRSFLITSEAAERQEVRQRRPLNDAREVRLDDKWGNVGRNFGFQPRKDLALEMLGRVHKLGRGSVMQFPRGLQVAEQRTLRGESPSLAHEAVARRRLHMISPAIERIRLRVEHIAHLAQERLRPRQRVRMPDRDRGIDLPSM